MNRPRVVAAIDVGSSGIRMEIAELCDSGEIRHLQSLHRSVLLGNDTFDGGRLGNDSVKATCETLKKFKTAMDEIGVTTYRAVATNAVREADNRDTFLDRVKLTSGIELEVIGGAEQSHLTYTAVQNSLAGEVDFENDTVALVEVGGGTVDVLLMERGEAIYADTFALGAIRVRQVMRRSKQTVTERTSFLRHVIETASHDIPRAIPLSRAKTLVALGGDVRFLAHHIQKDAPEHAQHWSVPREEFLKACRDIAEVDADRIAKAHNLSIGDATTLGPALLIYEQIVQVTPVDRVIIADANVRDGILLDMHYRDSERDEEPYARQIIASAVGLARKYQSDEKHALHVARLALSLFDEMQAEHGLSRHERLLLEVAAILHEIGSFVHSRSHHKHSLYLIRTSEIFGLGQEELDIIANVARYHRRSGPQMKHNEYRELDRSERVTVSKLAAILRVADALEKEHLQKIQDPKFIRTGDELQILVPKDTETRIEDLYLSEKGDFFQEIYGLTPILVPDSS